MSDGYKPSLYSIPLSAWNGYQREGCLASRISSRTLSPCRHRIKIHGGENPINTLSVCRWKPLIKDRNLNNKVQVKRGSTTRSSGRVRQLVDVASLYTYRHVPHYISFIRMKGAMLYALLPAAASQIQAYIFLNTLPINQRRIGRAYERILPVFFMVLKRQFASDRKSICRALPHSFSCCWKLASDCVPTKDAQRKQEREKKD